MPVTSPVAWSLRFQHNSLGYDAVFTVEGYAGRTIEFIGGTAVQAPGLLWSGTGARDPHAATPHGPKRACPDRGGLRSGGPGREFGHIAGGLLTEIRDELRNR